MSYQSGNKVNAKIKVLIVQVNAKSAQLENARWPTVTSCPGFPIMLKDTCKEES